MRTIILLGLFLVIFSLFLGCGGGDDQIDKLESGETVIDQVDDENAFSPQSTEDETAPLQYEYSFDSLKSFLDDQPESTNEFRQIVSYIDGLADAWNIEVTSFQYTGVQIRIAGYADSPEGIIDFCRDLEVNEMIESTYISRIGMSCGSWCEGKKTAYGIEIRGRLS